MTGNREMSQQYLKTLEKSEHRFEGIYNNRYITIFRENSSRDWYIIVTTKTGGFLYDGWWNDSFKQTIEEAIDFALEETEI